MNKSVRRSIIWTTVGRYSQMIISLCITMILSRYLTPSEFGIVATVLIFNNFLYTFIDAGIPSAIIQKKTVTSEDLISFNTIGLSVGICLLLVISICSHLIADFFSTKELSMLLPIMGINFIFLGLLGVPQGLLQRNLEFEKIAKIEITSSLLSGILAIFLAYNNFGYWALIIQLITQLLIRLILSLNSCPSFPWKLKIYKESWTFLKNYSSYLVAFTSINYWSRNIDNLVVARLYGENKLGLYSQAYRLMFLPVQLISSIINALIHPYFARKVNNGGSIYKEYVATFSFAIIFSAPIASFIFFNPKLVLEIVWGSQWIDAAEVLSILSILSLIQPALVTTGDVFKSTNNNKLLFKVGIINTLFTVCAIYIGALISFNAIAFSYVLIYIFFVTPLTLYFICNYALMIRFRKLLMDMSWLIGFVSIIYAINYLISKLASDCFLFFILALIINIIWILLTLLYFFKVKYERD
ncbi:lipopolysaccharide biosynthesis protein [Providencia sp. PROV092]|uniref:lipopolysaccharide biosynthesis protein n=1 Tax=Providencia sp. PROV092 TaxID=2949808 RepID=UPI00234A6D53|nr:lipopolysaccharide biosynthesis protein [Providencia sp. PROV092]